MAIPPLGHNPRAFPGSLVGNVTDEFGNIIISADNDGDITGDALTEFIQYGVWNGAFSIGPVCGTGIELDGNNEERRLPYWTGPVQVSGQSIYWTWEADSGSPSGYVLRAHIPAGAVGDESYFEQIVPIGGGRQRGFDHWGRIDVYRVSATATMRARLRLQYLDINGSALDSPTTGSIDLASDSTLYSLSAQASTGVHASPAANAYFLRVRVHIDRSSAAVTDSGTFDLTDVRLDPARPYIGVAEQSDPTWQAGHLKQSAGVLSVLAGGLVGLAIDASGQVVTLTNAGGIAFPATQIASADANTLDDYEEGTWTPVITFATVGNLNVVYGSQDGSYTKIGRVVVARCRVHSSTFTYTTSSGNLRVTGLPFTVSNSAGPYQGAMQIRGYTKANFTMVAAEAQAGQTYCQFVASGSGQIAAFLTTADVPSGAAVTVFDFVVTYEV